MIKSEDLEIGSEEETQRVLLIRKEIKSMGGQLLKDNEYIYRFGYKQNEFKLYDQGTRFFIKSSGNHITIDNKDLNLKMECDNYLKEVSLN